MTNSLRLLSPAKVNLMLHITGRRDDGYHELQTVFRLIGLYDQLTFTIREDSEITRNSANSAVAEADDLTVKAAKLLQRQYEVAQGVDIQIDKQIPMGGGLGGGSSDAATTLMALNQLWQLDLSTEKLQQIGLQLGADVPVFIFGRNAWGEGIGEHLTALDLPDSWYLIVHPNIFVSTAQVFSAQDLTRDCHPITIRAFLEGAGSNVCQPVAAKLYPEIQQAIDWLDQFGQARMTGTGACIFAAFDSAEKAYSVKSRLPEKWSGYVVQGLNTNPVTDACID
ncbi:MAG: 4-(cytidine 5'-diphospho)-2-C-methyl-D-erythritol kinase [Gammaproteobacteria bacterium]|nr:4-(cytidine 5'-diphospho)-2-C-methyl-D-erythritol kinase [Gammaproteobacteria bacterium]